MDMLEERKVIINLICPYVSLSKVVQVTALEDQRIDLGSISRIFGLDPLTIKINGHFISRGLDFITSSVTWKSLISFFSARGFSTGISATEPLRIDGKLCKLGTKSAYMKKEHNLDLESRQRNSQMCESNPEIYTSSEYAGEDKSNSQCDESGLKRKNQLDGVQSQKKMRMHQTNSGIFQSHAAVISKM